MTLYNSNYRETPITVDPSWPMPEKNYKYASLALLLRENNPFVLTVVENAPITFKYKRILVDVKVQDLVPNRCSCMPGWHLDGSMKEDEAHHLFIYNGPGTEFIAKPFELPGVYPENVQLIPKNIETFSVPSGVIASYTSLEFHRGVYTDAPVRRLLIRLTETNVIAPNNRPFKPFS